MTNFINFPALPKLEGKTWISLVFTHPWCLVLCFFHTRFFCWVRCPHKDTQVLITIKPGPGLWGEWLGKFSFLKALARMSPLSLQHPRTCSRLLLGTWIWKVHLCASLSPLLNGQYFEHWRWWWLWKWKTTHWVFNMCLELSKHFIYICSFNL